MKKKEKEEEQKRKAAEKARKAAQREAEKVGIWKSRKWKMETDMESGNGHGKWKIFHAKCSFFQEV